MPRVVVAAIVGIAFAGDYDGADADANSDVDVDDVVVVAQPRIYTRICFTNTHKHTSKHTYGLSLSLYFSLSIYL